MNKRMVMSLVLALATTGFVQAAPNNAPIAGVTVEREGGMYNNPGQGYWQDGHRMGPRGGGYHHGQRGQHWQQGPNGHRQGGVAMGLLTQAEAQAFHENIMASKDYNSCKKVQNQQHQTVLKRAKDKGMSFPTEPRKAGVCERLSDRGYFDRTTK